MTSELERPSFAPMACPVHLKVPSGQLRSKISLKIGPTMRTHYASGQVCTGTALPSEVFPDTAVQEL